MKLAPKMCVSYRSNKSQIAMDFLFFLTDIFFGFLFQGQHKKKNTPSKFSVIHALIWQDFTLKAFPDTANLTYPGFRTVITLCNCIWKRALCPKQLETGDRKGLVVQWFSTGVFEAQARPMIETFVVLPFCVRVLLYKVLLC